MKISQYEIWIADLEPRFGTETGKVRPVVVIQTDLLNNLHPSTIVCPLTTNVNPESEILRVHLRKGTSNLKEDCDILVDQIRAIDNKRFSKRLGKLPEPVIAEIKNNITAVLDL
ncbi:MAG: type II toxin-antitoxin system PemK/MazF family toxin [Ignavibacteria bacterium]|nr:type II toxin-antitoxin system PemK/MazF family toxin [Ignavibacteria bacterium]